MNNTKKFLIIIILLCTMLGFSLGVYYTQQYQASALPSATVPEKSSTLSRTATPVQTGTIEAIPSATKDLFFCMDNYVDWSTYKNKSLENIRSDIGLTFSSEEKDGFFKTNAQFVGRLSIEGEPIFDRLDFPIYLFEQNEETYRVSVNPRINEELEKHPSGTTMTLFIEVNTYDLQYISQTLLHDYKLADNEMNTPDIHWSVAIKQNGNLFSQEKVEIKNQPFTIEISLPRLALTPSSVKINIVEKEKNNFAFSENFDLSQNCSIPIGMVPDQPFCYGYGGPRRDRSLVSSNWEFAVIGMVDCVEFYSSNVHLDEANVLFETDILYISIPRSDFYPLSEDDKIPLSNFKNQNFVLTTFVDFNKNDIVETGEMKTIELHISE